MPPQRTVLGSISRNRQKGQDINPYIHGQVTGQAFKGAKNAQIAKDLNLSNNTIRYTLQQDELRANGESLPRKPRGKSYTDAEERLLIRHVRLNPKDTY
jgi:transcriptional antiterminator